MGSRRSRKYSRWWEHADTVAALLTAAAFLEALSHMPPK
jgi:hypothetical protein